MAEKKSAMRTVYHVDDGPVMMYEIDARHALTFKKEWKAKPWRGQYSADDQSDQESA